MYVLGARRHVRSGLRPSQCGMRVIALRQPQAQVAAVGQAQPHACGAAVPATLRSAQLRRGKHVSVTSLLLQLLSVWPPPSSDSVVGSWWAAAAVGAAVAARVAVLVSVPGRASLCYRIARTTDDPAHSSLTLSLIHI